MALSTRATLAGLGGALAIGVLGAGGVAYAAGGNDTGSPSYVTVVDDGSTGSPGAPGSTGAPAPGDRGDCPDKQGGSGSGPGPGGSGQSSESGAAGTSAGDA
jgi:hypothetical protein